MSSPKARASAALLAGTWLAAALAGCSSTSDASDVDTSPSSDTPAAGGSYADGTYTESGGYQAPSGAETVSVTLTLAGGTVSEVAVTGDATNPQAKRYQSEFADGISDVVVGKNIDELKVDRVAGSSLTSGGFNEAVDAIKADAAQ